MAYGFLSPGQNPGLEASVKAGTAHTDEEAENGRWSGRLIRGGQVATAIAAIAGLAILLLERLPKDPAPERLAVSLTEVRLERPVTFGRFLAAKQKLGRFVKGIRASGLPERAIRETLRTQGAQVSYLLQIEGPPGRDLKLRARVYRSRGLVRARLPPLTQTELYKSQAWQERAPAGTWVPDPLDPGRYYIDLRVTERQDGEQELVESARTSSFRVGGR